MKAKEIRKKTDSERVKLLQEKKKKLQAFYFNSATSRPKNTKEAVNLRKDIARIKTILKEYEK